MQQEKNKMDKKNGNKMPKMDDTKRPMKSQPMEQEDQEGREEELNDFSRRESEVNNMAQPKRGGGVEQTGNESIV